MFARVAVFLLLLLLNVLFVESSGKIHGSLKNVGKRQDYSMLRDIQRYRANKTDKKKWELLSEEGVAAVKNRTVAAVTQVFLGVSSKENYNFWFAFDKLFAHTHPDFVAEVCGHEKKMNRYQYMKFMRSSSLQYGAFPASDTAYWGYDDAPKDDLEVYIQFNQTDKNGIKTEMEFSVTFKALFKDGSYGDYGPYLMTKVVQGGTCLEHGKFAHSSSDEEVDVEKLQNHPDAITFLNLFTPKISQIPQEDKISIETILPKPLPSDWLLGIAPDAKLTVCHEDDIVDYTKEQFLSWYRRFVQMWHPKRGDEEAMKMQVLELKDGVLVARVTFNLQIGVNDTAPIHEWNFKIAAKKNDDKTWSITQLDVFCALSITAMDESYLVYRDVVGATFNSYVKDNEQWYFATNFGGHFRKYGSTVEVWSCEQRMRRFEELPKSFLVQGELWTATVIGYMGLEPLEPLPAAEDTSFTIRVKMQHPTENALYTPPPGHILAVDWKFNIKWDKMDQFYYIYKVDFKCPKWMHEETNEWTWIWRDTASWLRIGRK